MNSAPTGTTLTVPKRFLTEDNLGVAYGKVESESLLVDLNEYPILAVRSTAIDAGAKYSIGLQGQASPWPYVSLVDYQPEPAEHAFNILEETDWTGQQFFRIVIWIDGEMKGATFDMIPVTSALWPLGCTRRLFGRLLR